MKALSNPIHEFPITGSGMTRRIPPQPRPSKLLQTQHSVGESWHGCSRTALGQASRGPPQSFQSVTDLVLVVAVVSDLAGDRAGRGIVVSVARTAGGCGAAVVAVANESAARGGVACPAGKRVRG
jgi:hypothetical protein